MSYKNCDEFDWRTYFEEGESSLKKALEENPKMWEKWTSSKLRYKLISCIRIVENDVDNHNNICGKITAFLDCHVSSDDIESLRLLWKSQFFQQRYDCTMQHFIADMQEKKIVEFLSVCM